MLSGLIRRRRPTPVPVLVTVVATGGEAGPRSEEAARPMLDLGWS
jgi:hypothetical protein